MTQMKTTSLYGLVLTGGKSSRMGEDKSLLKYHGKTQMEYCFELLQNVCEKVFISNRKDQAGLSGHKGLPQIHDLKKYSDIGPLAGILSAMEKHPKAAWLILACDLPYVTAKTIEYLIQNRDSKQLATAYKSTQNQLPEPLCAVYESKFYQTILKFLKQGIDCPRKIMINSDVKLLEQTDPAALENINNPEELKTARSSLNKKTKIHVQYYALLREERGVSHETLSTNARTAKDLYTELQKKFSFKLSTNLLRVSVNDEFSDWKTPLKSGDKIVFIPPVAGG